MKRETVMSVGTILSSLGLYQFFSRAWDQWLIRDPWIRRKNKKLYSNLVKPGDIVVDIGANIGIHTQAFLDLGARFVVAVDCQPYCVDVLKNRFQDNIRVQVVDKALGRDCKIATMALCESHALSSLLPSWKHEVIKRVWTETVNVEMITLDQLIGCIWDTRNTNPDYIKLDIEGSEQDVIMSLSKPVPLISFEFLGARSEYGMNCLDDLHSKLGYDDFNFSPEGSYELMFSNWVSHRHMEDTFLADDCPDGDVFAIATGSK